MKEKKKCSWFKFKIITKERNKITLFLLKSKFITSEVKEDYTLFIKSEFIQYERERMRLTLFIVWNPNKIKKVRLYSVCAQNQRLGDSISRQSENNILFAQKGSTIYAEKLK